MNDNERSRGGQSGRQGRRSSVGASGRHDDRRRKPTRQRSPHKDGASGSGGSGGDSRGQKRGTKNAGTNKNNNRNSGTHNTRTNKRSSNNDNTNNKSSTNKSSNNRNNKNSTNRNGNNKNGNSRHSNRSNNHNRSKNGNNNHGRRSQNSQSHQDPLYTSHSDLPVSVETSAGGLVLSGLAEAVQPDGSVDLSTVYVALIGRLDRRGRLLWSMPKGHIEPNESTYVTAEREVWEETGVEGTVLSELGTIDYWFVSEGIRIHKTVHHHLLRFVDGELNDEDPEVTEVQWLPVNQLVERLAYADERRLARNAFDQLPELARAEARAGRVTPR
ncbi:NUDIX hydrolase [Corynebacterium sp. 320]|uniref:NUDIX hydrolase n=1 Tax=Corynebacterium TaxID=1716 RepID=UPI00125CC63C|nr:MULTISPECIES: NUDIX hydrolase [Corynebacterium]KAB1502819.1 NUDIX hydrolase [Corynebacterium sp. 320]KAB1550440.1 NUDIX hydrolase [Corynebacterium sp. 319]KAB1554829.1 NUDIX hydrolase [Corynebacterium sp. 321]KAB3526482.1 NUDIX hydrolase [Corynebacterium sp. 250]KAB3539801.1 NUDIX hydrolase [Corynebacterium sp. 366]